MARKSCIHMALSLSRSSRGHSPRGLSKSCVLFFAFPPWPGLDWVCLMLRCKVW